MECFSGSHFNFFIESSWDHVVDIVRLGQEMKLTCIRAIKIDAFKFVQVGWDNSWILGCLLQSPCSGNCHVTCAFLLFWGCGKIAHVEM